MLDKIISMIEETAFGTYDVSGWNPNVTLEYGVARGMEAAAFIAFNPDKTDVGDVPSDVAGYDRMQYTDLEQLSAPVADLVLQELGEAPTAAVQKLKAASVEGTRGPIRPRPREPRRGPPGGLWG